MFFFFFYAGGWAEGDRDTVCLFVTYFQKKNKRTRPARLKRLEVAAATPLRGRGSPPRPGALAGS